jgi:hypothetical protein
MLPIRWIMPVVGLLFALALLPRFFDAPESTRQRVASARGTVNLNDRFGPGEVITGSTGQPEAARLSVQTSVPAEPAIRSDSDPADRAGAKDTVTENAGVADANANDLTGSVQPRANPPPADLGSALAIEYPVAAAPAVTKPATGKRVRHVRRIRKVPAPVQASSGAQQGNWPSPVLSYSGATTPSFTGPGAPPYAAKPQVGQVPLAPQYKPAPQASYAARQQPVPTTPPPSGFPNAHH